MRLSSPGAALAAVAPDPATVVQVRPRPRGFGRDIVAPDPGDGSAERCARGDSQDGGSQGSVCTVWHRANSHPRAPLFELRRRVDMVCPQQPARRTRMMTAAADVAPVHFRTPVDHIIPPVKVRGAEGGIPSPAPNRGLQLGLGERSAPPSNRRPSRCSCRPGYGLSPPRLWAPSSLGIHPRARTGLHRAAPAGPAGRGGTRTKPSGPPPARARRTLEGVATAGRSAGTLTGLVGGADRLSL